MKSSVLMQLTLTILVAFQLSLIGQVSFTPGNTSTALKVLNQANGSTASQTIAATSGWGGSGQPAWINSNPASGIAGNFTINLQTSSTNGVAGGNNDAARQGTITYTGGAVLTVAQKGDNNFGSIISHTIPNPIPTTGGNYTITLTTGADWVPSFTATGTCSTMATFTNLGSPLYAVNRVINVSISACTTGRTGTISFRYLNSGGVILKNASGANATITLNQPAGSSPCSVSNATQIGTSTWFDGTMHHRYFASNSTVGGTAGVPGSSWLAARTFCTNNSASLAAFETQAERDQFDAIANGSSTLTVGNGYYIDLRRTNPSPITFTWKSGIAGSTGLSYTANWDASFPVNWTNYEYAHLVKFSGTGIKWKNMLGDENFKCICECTSSSLTKDPIEDREANSQTSELEARYFTLYPNPAFDEVNIVLKEDIGSDIEIEVLDLNGKKMMVRRIEEAQSKIPYNINVQQLNAGVFFIRIKGQDGVLKFVKH
ncbi:MAG: T9SS type A sorting domain-containing protein [Saprospiraceae bacterium]|nr:T9SS type A sorting domain-containing protein [Saprospiraceae bacterium]